MPAPPDFTTVRRNGELAKAIPALADLTPELLSNLWQRMQMPISHRWQSINGPDSWDANPWLWAISFKRITEAS